MPCRYYATRGAICPAPASIGMVMQDYQCINNNLMAWHLAPRGAGIKGSSIEISSRFKISTLSISAQIFEKFFDLKRRRRHRRRPSHNPYKNFPLHT